MNKASRKAIRTRNSIVFHVFSIMLGFLMIYPLLWLIASSFKSNDTMFLNSYSLIPQEFSIAENYSSGWAGISGVTFGKFIINTVLVTIIGTITCVFSSLLAAYAFSRTPFRGIRIWFTCVILTMMIPPQVMVGPQYIILKQIGLVDTLTSLILPWCFGTAFFIFLILQFFRSIPKDLDEAAEIDGCGHFRILFQILTPVVKPAIVTSGIFAFYWIWQDFFQPLIFINSTENFTVSLALNAYLDPTSFNNYGGLFAMSWISLIPVILFFIFFQKYLVNGIAMDGIKG